jgi:hypothetical protein
MMHDFETLETIYVCFKRYGLNVQLGQTLETNNVFNPYNILLPRS